MWCSVVGGAGVVRGSVVRGVCCGVVVCVMDRYHPDSLKVKKCLPLHGICLAFALWSPVLVFFFAVTVPLQLEVSKLNVNMVTCNGCNGYVTAV